MVQNSEQILKSAAFEYYIYFAVTVCMLTDTSPEYFWAQGQ